MKIASTKNEIPSSANADPEHLAERRHELRPQQPELERQDRPGHDADREQDQRHLRPALGQRLVGRVAGPQVEALDEQEHRGERDPEADDRDVDGQRQRLHLARLEQVRRAATTHAKTYCSAEVKIARVAPARLRPALRPRRVRDVRRAHDHALATTVVELETDDGLVGLRRDVPARRRPTSPPTRRGARRAAELAPALIGVDPRNLNAVQAAMDGALAGHGYAKAAVDIACWDLLGQAAGLPVSTLLGGARAERLPALRRDPARPGRGDGRARARHAGRRASAASSSSSAPTRARTPRACAPCSTPPGRTSRSSPTPTAAGACRTRRSPPARSRASTACSSSSPARRSRSA